MARRSSRDGVGGPRALPSSTVAVAALLGLLLACGSACTEVPDPPVLRDGQEAIYSFLSDGSISTANALVENRWDLGNRFPVVTIDPITWTEDPFGDDYWRFLFYSLRPTSNLLWAYYQTGQPKYRDKLTSILTSFVGFDEKRPTGPPYDRTTFDYKYGAAFRAMVLVNTVGKLQRIGQLSPELRDRLVAAIGRLGTFLAQPINFDPGYNHGLTEAAALALIAANYPELPASSAWQAIAVQRLSNLMAEAVDADGVEVENSPFYHFYVLGFAYQIARWAEAHGVPLPAEFRSAVARMIPYATLILQPDGEIPLLGSSVRLGVENLDAVVYGRMAQEFPEFEYVYSGGRRGVRPSGRAALFPVSGLAILRSGFGTGPADFGAQTHVTFNVGPYRSSHGHLDVLGITLSSAGARALTDPGVFTYSAGSEFDYFSGTRAHNTVTVGGADQMSTGPVSAGRSASGDSWGYQSGAHGLYPGVIHQRSVLLLERDLVLVFDDLESGSSQEYRQLWHLPPGLAIQESGGVLEALDPGGVRRVAIRQAAGTTSALRTATGETAPLQGWVSETFGVMEPATVLEYAQLGTQARYVTLVATGARAFDAPEVVAAFDAAGAMRVTICGGGSLIEVSIAHQAGPGEEVAVQRSVGPCP
jgi:hypothetical protein